MSVESRFWTKVSFGPFCWEWTGFRNATGYGRFLLDGKVRFAHRVAYELTYGPMPPGLETDHLCRNRACVNPSHLEAVSHRVNVLRGETVSGRAARKTHCPQGHPYAGDNLLLGKSGRPHRMCRACTDAKHATARELTGNIGSGHGRKRLLAFCLRGHPYDEINAPRHANGVRRCHACQRIYNQQARSRKVA